MDKSTNKEIALCIFAYNRYKHLKVTIEELSKYDLSIFDIYIFQDGPKNETDQIRTNEVRTYIQSLDNKITVFTKHRKKNIGLANSVFQGLNYIFDKYDQAIVLEDDIRIRPGFLEFLSAGLEKYKNETIVAGVSGFSYLNKALPQNYFLPIGCSWGWGTWKRVWEDVNRNSEFYKKEIDRRKLKSQFNFGSYPFYQILVDAVDQKNDTWDINFYASFFLKEQIFLFPNTSLCENTGFDGSGTHTNDTQAAFNTSAKASAVNIELPIPTLNRNVIKALKKRMREMAGKNRRATIRSYISRLINER